MKILVVLSLLICCLTGTLSDSTDPPTTTPQSTSSEPPTTTALPTTTSSGAPPTTTTAVPKTTPEPPKTTTEPPTTTPPPPPPPTTTVTSTSKEPDTTLTPIVTSTKVPDPEDCYWNVTDHDITCIRVELRAKFTISIEGKNHQINLGCEARTDRSDCSSNDTQVLMLYEPKYYNLTMLFQKTDDKKFTVKEIIFGYTLPEGEDIVQNNETKIFSVNTGKSYLCKTATPINLGKNITMNIQQIHIQAFLDKDNTDFGKVEECEADDKVSDVVPIAVGVALAALIIIVLIAYLVGRRRSRQKGYQSV